jgi:hypothetical protein
MQTTPHRRPEYVPNYYAYTLKVNGRALTKTQKKLFFDGLNKIHRENPTIVYRGDKKSTLLPLYHLRHNQFPSAFNDAIFLLGAKARQFTGDLATGPFAIDIAGAAGNEFQLIFRMLGNLLSRKFPFGSLRFRVISFKKDESHLTSFFRTPENEDRFIQILETFEPVKKITARDYYLALLHHISKSQYYSSSFLLSTTTSFPLAHKFAWSGENADSTDPIILFGWVPNNYEGVLSAPDFRTLKKKVDLEAAGLPVYNRSFFPYQQEVTLKGGLLPHYLIGYLHHYGADEIFEINPAFFQTTATWAGDELPVDQSTFQERIRQTDFGRYFSVNTDTHQFRQHVQ